ncbi:MAG: 50S ribosomal protein L32 [Parcubacteria group bacterium]|nr:50S ribosomal protein L32 [Parcubacteria group bacterium]
MPVPPKRRASSQRKRRASHFALSHVVLAACAKCGTAVRPHRVCPKCGEYAKKTRAS